MPSQNVDAEAGLGLGLGSDPFADLPVTEVRAELTRYSTADFASFTGVTDDYTPQKNQSARITVNGVALAQGVINEVGDNEDGSYSVEFYNAVRQLNQHSITRTFEAARADVVLKTALEAAGVTYDISLSQSTLERLDSTGEGQTGTTGGAVAGAPAGGRFAITESFTDAAVLSVLERVTRATGWYWFVDGENTVCVIDRFAHTEAPVHGGLGTAESVTRPDATNAFLVHPLRYVIDASAGKLNPPYERVVVYGAAGTRTAGRAHMLAERPVWGVATGSRYEQGDPTFRYRDRLLDTPEMCEAAALGILKRFQAEQTGGWVEIPGIAAIRPYDVIRMPDGEDGRPDLGGSQYLVQGVEHRVTNTDGFISRITVGGLLNAGQGTLTESGGGETGTPTVGGTPGETPGSGSGTDDTDGDGDTGTDNGGSESPDSGSGEDDDNDDDGGIPIPFPFGPIFFGGS